VAEDFFLRFGALVNTINVNKSAVAQAAKAIQGAINQKAAVDIGVNFDVGNANELLTQISKVATEAKKIINDPKLKVGAAGTRDIEGLFKSVNALKGASAGAREAIRLIQLNPKTFKDSQDLVTLFQFISEEIKVLQRDAKRAIKLEFDTEAIDKALEKTETLKTRLATRQQVLGSAIGQFIRARSAQEEQRAQLDPSYTARARQDIRTEALSLFDPSSVNNLREANDLINKVRGETQKITSENFNTSKAVKDANAAYKIREANANKIYSVEQAIKKTVDEQVKAEAAKAATAAKSGTFYRPKSASELERDIRSRPEVAALLSGGGKIAPLDRRRVEDTIKAEGVAAKKEAKDLTDKLTAKEKERSKAILDQLRFRESLRALIEKEVALEQKLVELDRLKGRTRAARSRADIASSVEGRFGIIAPGAAPATQADIITANAERATFARSQAEREKIVSKEIAQRQSVLEEEAKKRQKIRDRVRETYDALVKLNNEVARKAGPGYTKLSNAELAKQALEVNKLTGVNISNLTGASLEGALGRTTKASKDAKNALREFNQALRDVEGGRQSVLQFTARFGNSFERLGAQVTIATQRIAAYVIGASGIYGTVSFIRNSTGEFFKLEQQLTKVRQVLGDTVENNGKIKELSGFIKNLGTSLGIAPSEIASGVALLAQAGFTNVSELQGAIEAISQARLGPSFGSQEQTVDGLIAVYRQFNLTLSDTRNILDLVNQFSKDYAVESQDLFEIVKRGGSAFAELGGNFQEFLGISSALRQQTRESASVIGTSLKTITTSLFKPKFEKFLGGIDPKILQELNPAKRLQSVANLFQTRFSTESEKVSAIAQFVDVRNASRVLALFEALNAQAENLRQTTERSAGSVLRDAQTQLETVGKSIERARVSLQEAAVGLVDNPFIREIFRSGANLVSGAIAPALGAIAPIAAPAGFSVAIYALVNIIKSSIVTYRSLITSSQRLTTGLDSVNRTISILNNNITALSGRGTSIPGGPGGGGGGGGSGGGRGGGFFKNAIFSPLGQGTGLFLASGLTSILSDFVSTLGTNERERNAAGAASSAINVLGGGLGGAGFARLLGFGIRGTAAGAIAGAGLETFKVINQRREEIRIAEQQRQQEQLSARQNITAEFVSSGRIAPGGVPTLGPNIERFFLDQNALPQRIDALVSLIINREGNVQGSLENLVKKSDPNLTAAQIADTIKDLTSPEGGGTQAVEILRQSLKNAFVRAQNLGLTGAKADAFVKKELQTLLSRPSEGVVVQGKEIEKVFNSLVKQFGKIGRASLNLDEVLNDYAQTLELSSARIFASLGRVNQNAQLRQNIRNRNVLGSDALSSIFGTGAFTPRTTELSQFTSDAQLFNQFGAEPLVTPNLRNRINQINALAEQFRSGSFSGAPPLFVARQAAQAAAGEDNNERDLRGRESELQKRFEQLAKSGEVNVGEALLGIDKLREARIASINELIKEQNEYLKDAVALSDLATQKRFQQLDVQKQIVSIQDSLKRQLLEIDRASGNISDAQFRSGVGAIKPQLPGVATGLLTGGGGGFAGLGQALADVQKNFAIFSNNISKGLFAPGAIVGQKASPAAFGASINNIIQSRQLAVGQVNLAETDPNKLIADVTRAFNETRSLIPRLFDEFGNYLDASRQGVLEQIQIIQGQLQASLGFTKDIVSKAFGGTPDEQALARQEIEKNRDNLRRLASELQSAGFRPEDLTPEKIVNSPALQAIAEDFARRIGAAGDFLGTTGLAQSAGGATLQGFGFTGTQLSDLINLGQNIVPSLTGFNAGIANSFNEINKLKNELTNIGQSQIDLQKESIAVIKEQTSLVQKTADTLAKALEGVPDTITFKIEGLQDINLKFNLASAEQDIQNIKNTVSAQVVEYIRNALNTAGFSISSFTFPVAPPTP
jgi:hypothetical protein